MGLFESFRDKGWNTYYSELHVGASVDLTLVTVTYMAVVLFITMLMIVMGTRGQQVSANQCRPYVSFFLLKVYEV